MNYIDTVFLLHTLIILQSVNLFLSLLGNMLEVAFQSIELFFKPPLMPFTNYQFKIYSNSSHEVIQWNCLHKATLTLLRPRCLISDIYRPHPNRWRHHHRQHSYQRFSNQQWHRLQNLPQWILYLVLSRV